MGRKIFRLLCMIICLVVLISSFAGCQKGSEKKTDSSSAVTTQASKDNVTTAKTENVKTDVIEVWTNTAHEKDVRLPMIEKWNNSEGKQKGIKIDYKVYGSDYNDVMTVAANTGVAPHIFLCSVGPAIEAGWIMPLEDLPGAREWINQNYKPMLKLGVNIFNDKVYNVPWQTEVLKFVYNPELFKKAGIAEPPKTWDEVREDAKKVTAAGGGKQFGWAFALQSNWTMWQYTTWPAENSIGHFGFDFKTGTYRYIDLLPFLKVYLGMRDDGSVFPGSTGLNGDTMRAQFAEGNIAMLVMPQFDVGVYTSQFPAKFDYEVTEVPVLDLNNQHKLSVKAGAHLNVGVKAKELPEKTFEVYKFFHADDAAAELFMASKVIPVKDVSKLITKQPVNRGFDKFAPSSDWLFMPPIPNNFISVEGKDYRDTLIDAFQSPADKLESILTDIDTRYNAALKKAIDAGKVKIDDFIVKDYNPVIK